MTQTKIIPINKNYHVTECYGFLFRCNDATTWVNSFRNDVAMHKPQAFAEVKVEINGYSASMTLDNFITRIFGEGVTKEIFKEVT